MHINPIKFQCLLHTMIQGVVYHDSSGKIIYANPAAERILGLTHDQIFGKTSFDPDWRSIRENGEDFPGAEHPVNLALKTARPIRNVVMGIRPGKSIKTTWIMIDAIPELNENGKKVDQVLVTFSDITTLKELRWQEKEKAGMLKSIMESSSESIWSIDKNMKLRFANTKFIESCYSILGRPIHVGDYVIDFVEPDKKEFWIRNYQKALGGESFESTETYLTESGKKYFRMNLNPIFSGGEIIGASVFAKDITVLENFLATIQLHNDRFREISWIQSHVIRAPVARLMGVLNLISEESDISLDEIQRLLQIMKSSCKEIDDLIRDVAMKSEDILRHNTEI